MSNFSQKILIIVTAIAIAVCGVWYLQREWVSQDPARIKVDPVVEQQILALLQEAKGAPFHKQTDIFYNIRSFGQKSVPVLVRALQSPDAQTRTFAVNLLQYSENPSVIPYLEAKLQDEEPIVRKASLNALGTLSAVDTVPTIILVLNDKDDFTRCQAALVLGTLKDNTAVLPLVHLLQEDPYPVARRTAAHSLGEIGDRTAVPPLIASLGDNDLFVRSASMVALNRITGQRLGSQKEVWADWWKQQEAE